MPRYPSLSRSVTLRAAAAVAARAATVPAVGARAAKITPLRCPSSRSQTIDGPGIWQSFTAPTFASPLGLGSAPQNITAYAVDPTDASRIAVTNGNSIYVSHTSGCEWSLGLRLDQVPADPQSMPLSGQFANIRSLYIAPKSHTFYATAEELETGATVGRPHVLYSTDGESWHLGDDGLPPLGTPLTMRASVTAPGVMYLSFKNARDNDDGTTCPPPPVPCPGGDGSGRPLGLMWGSSDGGRTWSSRTDPSDLNGTYPIKFISVEDDDPSGRTLWVVANGMLRKSIDGGRTFTVPDGANQKDFVYSAVESINRGTDKYNPVKLVAFSTGGEMLRLDKKGWHRTHVPFGAVESVAQRPEGDIAVATKAGGGAVTVWRIFGRDFNDYEEKVGLAGIKFVQTFGWEPITPGGRQPLMEDGNITGGGGSPSAYFLRDRRRVLRFLGSSARDGNTIAPAVPINAAPPPKGHIAPSVLTIDLPRNGKRTVNYTLTLPPAPAPIDLFLLLDNSGSMQPLLEDLKQNMGDVVRTLSNQGVDVQAGVGQINVQPDSPPLDDPRTIGVDEGKSRPLYELLRRIGPVDTSFFAALTKVDGNGGSGEEAQLESLWQSVNGDGLSILGVPYLTGYSIPPHQQAGFRTDVGSIKVIVHATDEMFSTDIKGQGAHNTPGPVGAALKSAGVRQIGLSQGVTDAKRDLEDMARRTGAVAPPGGTDCDGDGNADIPAGDPLVCDQNYGLDKTLVNLLRSLRDHQTILVDQTQGPTLRSLSRSSFAIDAKQPTTAHFSVEYSCVGLAAGSYDNVVGASLRGIAIAKAVATVNCGGVPPLGRPGPNDPVPPPPVQPPAPIPAPIAPVNPITQAQTNVQSQINPQAGAVEQEQEEIQVATAQNDIGAPDDDELAMVGLAHDSPWSRPALTLGAGMALASAMGASVALRRRTRTRLARATLR